MSIVLVGIGGMAGSIFRYLFAYYMTKIVSSPFPVGTFLVNLIGSLLIGLFYGLSVRYDWFSTVWRVLLISGLCGGFTTFSSFSYENIQLLQTHHYQTFALYSFGSFTLCLLATAAGIYIIK